MRQVGAKIDDASVNGAVVQSTQGMAKGAAGLKKDLLAADGVASGCWGRLFLMSEPGIKVGLAFCYHKKAHVRMLGAAKLGAFAPILARLISLEDESVDLSRDSVHFAV